MALLFFFFFFFFFLFDQVPRSTLFELGTIVAQCVRVLGSTDFPRELLESAAEPHSWSLFTCYETVCDRVGAVSDSLLRKKIEDCAFRWRNYGAALLERLAARQTQVREVGRGRREAKRKSKKSSCRTGSGSID